MQSFVIAGAGAIGSFLAARLDAAGLEVCVLAREREGGSKAIAIELALAGETSVATLPLVGECRSPGAADFVFLCTKAADVGEALQRLAPCVGPATVFLTVQNGVDSPGEVAARFPQSTVLAARVHGFFEKQGERVRHVGVAPSLVFGLVSGGSGDAQANLAEVFAKAGIAARVSENIAGELWEKLVLTSAFGGVGAATGMAAGALRADPEGWMLLTMAVEEVVALAETRGIRLDPGCAERTLAFIAAFPGNATTSMQRDLEAGRGSEYAWLTGAVIRMAAEAGVPVPAHRRLAAMIRARGLAI